MKTRLLILGLLLSMATSVFAQEGSIIYKELDSTIYSTYRFFHNSQITDDKNGDGIAESILRSHRYLEIDFDEDGEYDYVIAWIPYKWWHIRTYSMGEWWFGRQDTYETGQSISYINIWVPAPQHSQDPMYTFEWGYSFDSVYIALRKPVGEDSYVYSWVMFSIDAGPFTNHNWPYGRCTIHSYAYCTIPDYPLRFGQTCLDWQVEENVNQQRYRISPNPAEDKFTIRGSDIAAAELFTLSGQRVYVGNKQSENVYSFNLEGLPAGIYVVRITDNDGNIHSEKVVKR